MTSLQWRVLFGDAGIEGVLSAFQGGDPFVVHGEWARLPGWLQHECLRSPEDLCARYGGRILYGRRNGGPRFTQIERGSASDLLASGEALYLPDVSEVVTESNDWLRHLESILGIPVGTARVTAWLAPAGEGTALHLDAEDVVSIQLVGRKTFEVAESVALPYASGFQFGPGIPAAGDLYPQAAAGFPDPAEAAFTAVDLHPGSLLVLPRGHWHRTYCLQTSLSVSIVLSPPILADWALGVLRHQALQQPRWRRPLYGAPTEADRAEVARGWRPLLDAMVDVPADEAWTEATTLQRAPSKRVQWGEVPTLHDLYDGTSQSLHGVLANPQVIAQVEGVSAAFTLTEARRWWGSEVEDDLRALVRVGLLYRWPVPLSRS